MTTFPHTEKPLSHIPIPALQLLALWLSHPDASASPEGTPEQGQQCAFRKYTSQAATTIQSYSVNGQGLSFF